MSDFYPVAIPDPNPDPWSAYEQVILPGGQRMSVHKRKDCTGYWCPIHYPTQHHMRPWPQVWTKSVMWRICPHKISHPDPDDWRWHMHDEDTDAQSSMHKQTCDGCCARPFEDLELL